MDYEIDDKRQLMKELYQTRMQISELMNQNLIRAEIEKEKQKIEHSLRERVKELNCLYRIAELVDRHEDSIEKVLQGVVDLLSASWQYPELTCARIIVKDREYKISRFKKTKWKQTAEILEEKEPIGTVEVYYLVEMPELDEGPFLKEERLLINAVAEQVGRAVERINARKKLEAEQETLRNMNITLKEVMARVQDEQKEAGKSVQANVEKVIMPILHSLKNEVSFEQQTYIRLIEQNLEDIVSPFINKLSRQFMSLTPAEIQICNMIKSGLSTKEIANLRYISHATVNRHREHIRKKLGLNNKKINLSTYLRTCMSN
ncbi:MAG: LuxR family transcriptional regulator [Proteobacteria bacterium]|nr:LuxR family transcriptional regulator [Pseudomonadota bacterium]